jgi:iron only hydrogenase large subunit-like protein
MAAGTNIVCVMTPRELRKSINMSIIRISRIPQSETCAQTRFAMASLPKLLENIKTRKEFNVEIHLSCLDNGGIIKRPLRVFYRVITRY